MPPLRLFLSSVQKEFAEERRTLREYLRGDPLMRRFFEPFVFEFDVPATDRPTDRVYLDEVDRCDIYVGLFGDEYGHQDAEGVSPTEREFDRATARGRPRLIFVRGADDRAKHPRMQALIRRVSGDLIRRRFSTQSELLAALYASLVRLLEQRQLIRSGPFDASPCVRARLDDLDPDKMAWFIREARRARGFPLREDATPDELLEHLNLLDGGMPTNAAVLLFARQPQRFLLPSEVKCAHYHGTEVAKPIPSYQVYKGTVFDMVDNAVDFVMSKLNLAVGDRRDGVQAPVAYEIPREVVAEAIVNAVAHRDYASNGSVQVMLFADRLEVWNPGSLPESLTLEKLRTAHGSIPANPLLAEPLYLTRYIERMGTGTRDMMRRCREAGLPDPAFDLTDGFLATIRRPPSRQESRPESRPESRLESRPQSTAPRLESLEGRVLELLEPRPRSKAELARGLNQKQVSGQLQKVLRQLHEAAMVEWTIPEKPQSRLQKYRLTPAGQERLKTLREEG